MGEEHEGAERRAGNAALEELIPLLIESNNATQESNSATIQATGAFTQLLAGQQKDRRRDRILVGIAIVVAIAILLGLGVNAVQGSFARRKLVHGQDVQGQTLDLVKRAVDPNSDIGKRGRAEQAQAITALVHQLDCNTRIAIDQGIARATKTPVPPPPVGCTTSGSSP